MSDPTNVHCQYTFKLEDIRDLIEHIPEDDHLDTFFVTLNCKHLHGPDFKLVVEATVGNSKDPDKMYSMTKTGCPKPPGCPRTDDFE